MLSARPGKEKIMDIKANFSYRRQAAREVFARLLFQARLNSWAGILRSGKTSLDDFGAQLPRLKPNRKYAGTLEIPVQQISGSVGRVQDFDRRFRPLKKHLANRWIANYLFLQEENWPSIRVYQVGNQYFVVDGHHRVSVARSRGMAYILAEVWKYELKESPSAAPAAHPAKVYLAPSEVPGGCAVLPCSSS
jgi:hypothetical protein